jgi:hypothetical protein
MKKLLFFILINCLANLSFASTVILNADPSFKVNYISYFVFSQSTSSPSQNSLIPLGQIGPQNLNSAGQDPIPTMQNAGINVPTAKVQVTIVLANSTQPVQTFCSTAYYDFSLPTTVNVDATHSAFIPGPCAAEITSMLSSGIY